MHGDRVPAETLRLMARSTGAEKHLMVSQTIVILVGLGLAAWGHVLVHDLPRAAEAWSRVDNLFPRALRSTPSFAGRVLLMMGAMLVLMAVLG